MSTQEHPTTLAAKDTGQSQGKKNPDYFPQAEKNNSQTISLLNFDPNFRGKKFLNSPRSIEALKRVCFEEHELLIKTKEDFVNYPVPLEFADDKSYYYEVKAEHYEKRRKEKVKLAIQERAEIIKEEQKKMSGTTMYNCNSGDQIDDKLNDSRNQTFFGQNFADKEMRKIQQMKNQQKKEIEFIILNDLKTQEMLKKNEEKLQRIQEQEQKRLIELEKKHQLAEIEKKKREEQKLEREKEQEEINRAMIERQKLEEQKRREIQEKIDEERSMRAMLKEKERREKAMMREMKLEEMEAFKREWAEKKKEEREQRLAKIKQEAEEKNKKKQQESEQTRKAFEFKIKVVRMKVEEDREDQRRRVLERQNITNSKREKFEEEKRMKLEERRNRSEAKAIEIKKSLEDKYWEEQAKNLAYLDKLKKAEENKRMRDKEQEQQRLLKIQIEKEKEERLKQTLLEQEREKSMQNTMFLKNLTEEQIRAEQKKEENLKNLKKRYIVEILKMEDAEENNKRLEKIRENKRNQIAERITVDSKKIQQLQAEREKTLLEKKKIQNKLEAEKTEALKEFEKKKKLLMNNKISVADISSDLKVDTSFQQSNYKNPPTSKSQQKFLTVNEAKNGSRSLKQFSANRTMNADLNEGNSGLVDNGSKSFVSSQKHEGRKGSQPSHFSISEKRDDKKLPKSFLHSPYNRPNKEGKDSKEIKDNKDNKDSNNTKDHNKGQVSTNTNQDKPLSKITDHIILHRNDAVVLDLQSKEYKKESTDLRKDQLSKFLSLVDQAMNEDKDSKKIEPNMDKFVDVTQKHQEEIKNIRKKNNYLMFA